MSNPQNGTVGTLYAAGPNSERLGQLVFPASINAAEPAALTDTNASMLSMDTAGRLRVVGPAAGTPVVPAQQVDSLAARATVAAPGLGVALVTLVAPAAGYYRITATVFFTVAGAANNAEFREGATVVSSLQLPAVVSQVPLVHTFWRVLDGATNLSINATAADAVGNYSAMLIATRQA